MGNAVTHTAARGGRNVDKLVTDYISALGNHLMYTLREKLGAGVLKSTPLEYIVTVPAIWSDLAKDKTRQACQRASALSVTSTKAPIHLISEPEAAAIYALHGLDPHGLRVGDRFVVPFYNRGQFFELANIEPSLQVLSSAMLVAALSI